MKQLNLISTAQFEQYSKNQSISLNKHLKKIISIDAYADNFNFYFSNAATFSSMIEGNQIDFDSYMKYHSSEMNNTGKSFNEIEDLKRAYAFAKDNQINLNNFFQCHQLLSNTLINETKYQGTIRDKEVYIFSNGRKIYTGASKEIVHNEINKLFEDIKILISCELSIQEIFYYASMLHLKLAHIHPFADGNGRISRLLEKWFLSEKLGINAWFIQSERLYQNRIVSYYKNINLGSDYESIQYEYSMPFLLMLPMALRLK